MEGKRFKNKTKTTSPLFYMIELILLAILIYSGYKIINWYLNNKQNEQLINIISESIVENDDDNKKYNVNFENLKKQNSDTVAWIKVENTEINFPVVKCDNNDFYLKHNFEKKYNIAGWIFADYRNKFDGTDKNIILYGHNMKNDSMFGTLKNTLDENWYNNEQNKYVTLITENEYSRYEIFSVYRIEAEDYYIKTNFESTSFIDFVQNLKNRSIKDFGIDISENDSILTLSTCGNNNKERIVLHGIKKEI